MLGEAPNFVQIKEYPRGGGIWVPEHQVEAYKEYRDPRPGEEKSFRFERPSADFKHQILPGDLARPNQGS